jgi:Ulp1 family protease
MEKAFKTRLAEETQFCSKTPRKAGREKPLDVQMAKVNKQRRDDAQNMVETSDVHFSKRPRTRLLDGMCGEDYHNARVQANPGQIDIMAQIDDIITETSRRFDQDPLDIRRFSRRIHRGSPNPHLSGSRTQPDCLSRQTERLWTPEENVQKITRGRPVDQGLPWKKPLLYPKYGKKKASVEFSDLERLEETEFLNDNLIGFYLRYLEQRLEEARPEVSKKVYFFNTFFYASLTNTQRGKRGINYEAVQKWTRSVDIFAFDYVVVPINESSHWYLAIICNLPALLPNFASTKNSPETKDACSPHHDQCPEDSSSAAALPDDRSSSPTVDVTRTQHDHPAMNESKVEPSLEDQAPTTSFAEMSLEAEQMKDSSNTDRCTSRAKANDRELRAEEQGILDAQIKDVPAQLTARAREIDTSIVQNGEVINVDVAVSSQEQKVDSAKKRKRKSAPPITRINPDSPSIITFDSLGLTHSPTIRILKDYLLDEGRAKRGLQWEELPIRGVTAKDIPQQNNFCDCGLFLLGYVDKFLDDPKDFTSKVLARQYNVEKDWPRLNPSMLRVSIRQQIMDLHKDQVDDQRESAKKADKYHGKEQNTDGRSHPKDDVQVDIRPGGPSSSHSSTPRRQRSQPLEINPRRGMRHKEALKSALEIGAPETQNCVDSSRIDDEETGKNSREGSYGSQIEQVLLEHDLDSEPNNAATKRVSEENENTRQLDTCQQLQSSPSAISAEVGDQVQTLREISRVVEDSQPDSVQEILSGEPPTIFPRTPIRKADHDIEQDLCRSPSTVGAAEKRAVSRGPLNRPSKVQKREESLIIELDSS